MIRSIINKTPDIKAINSNLGASQTWIFTHPSTIKSFLVENYDKYEKILPIFKIDDLIKSVIFSEG